MNTTNDDPNFFDWNQAEKNLAVPRPQEPLIHLVIPMRRITLDLYCQSRQALDAAIKQNARPDDIPNFDHHLLMVEKFQEALGRHLVAMNLQHCQDELELADELSTRAAVDRQPRDRPE